MVRARFVLMVLLALLLSFVLSSANAQAVPAAMPLATTASDPIPAGQIGGVTTAIMWSDGNLFFNVGPRIVRLAVSAAAPLTPTLPAVYGGILPGIPEDMKLANGYLYVALGRAGVAVVDATTLAVVSTQPLTVTASAVAVAVGANNGHLYLATGLNGIVEYAIGLDHTTLTYVQTKAFTNPVRRVTDVETRFLPSAGDEYLFVAANNASAVPANRGGVLKFNLTTEAMLGTPVTIKEQIDVNALALTDDFVYAAGNQAFYTMDTSAMGTGGSFATLVLPGPALEISLRPAAQTAYVLDVFGGIDVIDITLPLLPAKKTIDPFYTNGSVMNVAAAQFNGDTRTYLYLADFSAGLSIASAPQSTPENLSLDQSSYVTPKPAIVSVVGAAYPQAFVYSIPSTQWTVDTANLSALNIVGAGLVPSTTVNAIVPYSNSVLIGDQFGLTRYQLNPSGEPSNPEEFPIPGSGAANAIAVAWPNAIVANGSAGLAVVNLSGPMDLVGTAPAPFVNSDFRSVDVQGNYAYVGDYNGTVTNAGRLRIYDLTDPALPTASGSVSQTGILDVKVSGHLAFLAVGPRGIRVADVTNPAAPILLAADDYTGTLSARSLSIYKNFLFVAQGDAGVQMLAFDPITGKLRLIANLPTSGSAQKLVWERGRLSVAADYAGLMVFEIGNDLAITKTAPAVAYMGQPYTYTLTVGNVGVLTATNVVVTDVLAANLSLVSATGCATDANVVTCTLPSLTSGGSAAFNLAVQPNLAQVYTNTAYVTSDQLDLDSLNNSSQVSTNVLPVADLLLSKTASASQVYVGDRITYTLALTNTGPSTATEVVLTDTLPAGVTLVQANLGCSGTTTLVCNLGTLNVGVTQTVTIVVATTNQAATTITNTAVATAAEVDFTPAGAQVATTILPVATLTLDKTDSADPVYVGDQLVYGLTVVNTGPSAATGVIVTDTLPAGVTLENVSNGCTGTSVITCSIGSLNLNGNATVLITVRVTASAASVITNTAVATANEWSLSSATASASTTVLPVADLSITKSAGSITGTAGLPLTYSLVVHNAGPSTATGVVVTDTLPATVQFVSATGGACTSTTSVVCNLSNLIASGTTTVTLTVLPMSTGTISNTATVGSAVYDPNLVNNTTNPVVTPVKARLFLPLARR